MFWMTFPAAHKFAAFTWYGCTIELDGVSEVAYVADENPMVSHVNVHAAQERRRRKTKDATASPDGPNSQRLDANSRAGPRCIVIGPTDCGKSCLVRMLLGWATRQGWKPTYSYLDIGQGSTTVPGTVSATPVEMPTYPIEGVPLDVPVVYFYGHTTPSVNLDLYIVLVKELARTLDIQCA